MAKDDTHAGGLFSKVVRFVKNPATTWNELDEASTDRDNSLSKQALKEMIERKRRNDFVRKREFDMLRKLRRREATGTAPDGSARPSFFQSSMPSRPDDRAMTLKKIDEIEAQMSMQWWKTKHGAAGSSVVPAGSDFDNSNVTLPPPGSAPVRAPGFPAKPNTQSLAYARTAPDDLRNGVAQSVAKLSAERATASGQASSEATAPASMPDSDFSKTSPVSIHGLEPALAPIVPAPDVPSPTKVASAPAAPARDLSQPLQFTPTPMPQAAAAKPVPAAAVKPPLLGGLAASYDGGATTGFSASKLFAVEVGDVQHDPELEEASIRFANGDDQGAEAGLLEAVSPRGPRHQHEESWLTLFDLYRATSQYDRFESLAIDFASKFNRSSPMWFSIPEMVSKMGGASQAAPLPSANKRADWKSPANFGIQSLATMNVALSKKPMPWSLDWSALKTIEDAAVAPLAKHFLSWAAQPVQLRFAHVNNLDDVLRQGTPSGIRTTDQDRWNLLLAFMRISHRPDEFELAALDFCVTYEVSPPSWESARCEYKTLDADGNTGEGQTIIGDAMHDSISSEVSSDIGSSSTITAQLASVELSGQIMGEPKPVLDKLEARLSGADVMIISCAKLIRVDFSAAGSLLNWVSARQAEGRLVQFTDVHRLVAAFFHVIGISEHAKVSTRID
jgi:ABC-type transporter Mla MlaB component